MKKTVFTGSGVAIITPFTPNDEIDFESLGKMLDYHVENSTDAIIICGTTGEAPTLPDDEHLRIFDYAKERVGGKIPLIGGTGSNYTDHAIEFSRYAQKAGLDGVLCVTPYYNKTTQKGLVTHYNAIANAIDIPVILYNVPSRTGVGLSLEALDELSKTENIVAIKEASGNVAFAAKIAANIDMQIYSGNDDMIVPILSIGGIGVISVVANVAPKQTHDMCKLYFDGKVKEAAKMQLEMMDLVEKLFIEVNPIPVKNAMNMMGMDVGELKLPLVDLSEENAKKVRKALVDYGIKVIN